MNRDEAPSTGTRQSLVEGLVNWQDRARWQQFFDTYARLIRHVARRAGLHEAECEDVVQETALAVARNVVRYDRHAGSFKAWLLQMARWRIADQFRKRLPEAPPLLPDETDRQTALLDRIAVSEADFQAAWDAEWHTRLLEAALDRIKRRVAPAHFQVFDCAMRQRWSATKIARELGVSLPQVYLIKHRLSALLKKELRAIQDGEAASTEA